MVLLEEHYDLINTELSEKYDVKVYDFRNSKFVSLVRVLGSEYHQITNKKRECFTLLSDENTSKLSGKITYGYSNFENENIVHVSEVDSFTIDSNDSNEATNFPNRIATSKQIITSAGGISEINIKTRDIGNNQYVSLKPDYIFCVNEITQYEINESKRLGIPIMLTSQNTLENQTNELGKMIPALGNELQNYIFESNDYRNSQNLIQKKLENRLNTTKNYTSQEIQRLYNIAKKITKI